MKILCSVLLAHILAFKNNIARCFFLHTPVQALCSLPISCMCSTRMCQVAFEVYRNLASQLLTYVTRFAKTRHDDIFLEIQIFALVSSIYLKLCSVAISMLYCKYFSSYRLDTKRSNTLALYAFLWRLILHVLNAIIT